MSKIQVDSIVNKDDTGGVDFPKGVTVTGVVTATSFAGNATGLTGTPNIIVGVVTATEGLTLDGQNGSGKGLKLDLAGSGDYTIQETTANDTVQFGGTGSANFFRHNVSSGNIGIGTTADATLHVFKAGDGQTPVHFQTGNSNGHLYFYNDSDGYSIDSGGDIRFVTSRTSSGTPERGRFHSSGYFLIGCTSLPGASTKGAGFFPDTNNVQLLLSSSSTSATAHVEFFNTNGKVGTIQTDGSSTSYNTSSDYRLKENVVNLDGAIGRVKQLAPKRFNFIADETDTLVDGFLAHEAQAVVPEAVSGTHNEVDDDGNAVMQGIDQSKLVPLLTAALQEAIAKIETLEAQNTAILARLDALEAG